MVDMRQSMSRDHALPNVRFNLHRWTLVEAYQHRCWVREDGTMHLQIEDHFAQQGQQRLIRVGSMSVTGGDIEISESEVDEFEVDVATLQRHGIVDEVEEAFLEVDTEDSGSIAEGDLQRTLKLLGQQADDDGVATLIQAARLQRSDEDRNGKLEFPEFLRVVTQMVVDGKWVNIPSCDEVRGVRDTATVMTNAQATETEAEQPG